MSLRALFAVVGILCFGAEIALPVILIVRRQYRQFPVFTLYLAYNLLSDLAIGAFVAIYSMRVGQSLQLALLPLQYLLELGVLFEIAWNVLKPVRTSLPKGAVRTFIGLVCVAILGGTFLALHGHDTSHQLDDIKRPLDLTVGLLRMLIFAVTAGFAQVLGIGWKNKVLQLATALSFYSAMDLVVTLGERHFGSSNTLDPIKAIGYLFELSFLVWAFTTKDVRRREFSPQMEQFLVTLAGRARVARTALVRMQVK
jgi:hypothetical protein